MKKNLEDLRHDIDSVDKKIVDLFYHRMDLCKDVADYKKENSLPIYQKDREKQILKKIQDNAKPGYAGANTTLFSTIMEISKVLQQTEIYKDVPFIKYNEYPENPQNVTIGVPGTLGSNSHTAALQLFNSSCNVKFYSEFEDICKALDSGIIDFGVLPINNSTTGTVNQTYELAQKYDYFINKSTTVTIKHCLAAKQDVDIKSIKKVYSHPQALSQCSEFLKKNGFIAENYSNTALAAKFVSESDKKDIAAICSKECAEIFGLKVLEEGINDVSLNVTKFISISKKCFIPKDADKISIILTIENECGSLYKVLTKFFVNNLNMEEIESRPMKDGSFNFKFYIDFEGNIEDKKVKVLLNDLRKTSESFKFLGNYKLV